MAGNGGTIDVERKNRDFAIARQRLRLRRVKIANKHDDAQLEVAHQAIDKRGSAHVWQRGREDDHAAGSLLQQRDCRGGIDDRRALQAIGGQVHLESKTRFAYEQHLIRTASNHIFPWSSAHTLQPLRGRYALLTPAALSHVRQGQGVKISRPPR